MSLKILCNYTASGPSFVRTGWKRVFEALGHEFRFWEPAKQAAFDVFSDFEPDVYLGTTYETDRAIAKNIARRPQMKVALYASAWGPYLKDVDLQKYPLVVAAEQEKRTIDLLKRETNRPDFVFIHAHGRWLDGTMSGWSSIGVPYKSVLNAADTFIYLGGKKRPELECDIAFVGGYWGYKARNLDKYLLPLCHPSKKLRVKVFGNQPWPVHQYLGTIDEPDVADLFASATVCPNISEPHSTDLGWDVIERPFKILSSGGFCVSDSVEEAADLFTDGELPTVDNPRHLEDLVRHCMLHPEHREPYMRNGRRKVLMEHTYFDRVAAIFDGLGMQSEMSRTMALKGNMLEGQL